MAQVDYTENNINHCLCGCMPASGRSASDDFS